MPKSVAGKVVFVWTPEHFEDLLIGEIHQ